jgi:hypothetical protein
LAGVIRRSRSEPKNPDAVALGKMGQSQTEQTSKEE